LGIIARNPLEKAAAKEYAASLGIPNRGEVVHDREALQIAYV